MESSEYAGDIMVIKVNLSLVCWSMSLEELVRGDWYCFYSYLSWTLKARRYLEEQHVGMQMSDIHTLHIKQVS